MMQNIAHLLLAEERRVGKDASRGGRAAFRVCEKLRRPLCDFAGVAGFRSLLSRALVLAKAETTILTGVVIKPDGSFEYSAELEAILQTDEAGKGGTALLEQLLTLLVTFIGEALTLRLAHEVWPAIALTELKQDN